MKEATGELNMTVVTVVAIAAVAAFFYAFVWPAVKDNITSSTKCANATCDSSTCTTQGSKTVCTGCHSANAEAGEQAFSCSYEDGAKPATGYVDVFERGW